MTICSFSLFLFVFFFFFFFPEHDSTNSKILCVFLLEEDETFSNVRHFDLSANSPTRIDIDYKSVPILMHFLSDIIKGANIEQNAARYCANSDQQFTSKDNTFKSNSIRVMDSLAIDSLALRQSSSRLGSSRE
ncbi:hypothetical protein EAG_05110 [Camponotus floridanus]|uniref:Uncharacterized protein n=1 Tax=Camponotus floridanus TaxID=104421 RepID=E1ZVJ2_CAMFO|nr:hypothetical protein EAG_05110 [Camponotus floridanus]